MVKPLPTRTALGDTAEPRPSYGVAKIDTQGLDAPLAVDRAEVAAGQHLIAGANDIAVAQDHFDTLRAEDAFNQLQQKKVDLSVGDEGFATKKGAAAVTQPLLADYGQKFKDAQGSIAEGLQNDRQREKFNRRAGVAEIQYKQDILKHVYSESLVYGKQVLEGTVKTEVRNAQVSWDDPYAVQISKDRIGAAIDSMQKQHGWGPEETAAVRQNADTEIATAVVGSAVANGDVEYAQNYYDANRKDMDLATQNSLLKVIKDGEQKTLSNTYQTDFLSARDDPKLLGFLEERVTKDERLDEGRKNLLIGRILSRQDTLERRAEAEARRQEKVIQRGIDQVNSMTLHGFEPTVEQMQPLIDAAKGTDLEQAAAQMVATAETTRRFRQALPAQQESYLSNLEAAIRKDPTKFDVTMVGKLREIYNNQQRLIADDPQSFMVRQGLAQPLAINLAKPEDAAPELAEAASRARTMAGLYQAPMKILTKEQKDLLVGAIHQAPVRQRRDYFASLARATGEDTEAYSAIMGQIAPDDPVTAIAGIYAGRGIQDEKGNQVADLILRGQAILHPNRKEDGSPDKGKLWPMPQGQDEKTMHQLFSDYERDAFAGHPQARSAHYQAALAIYAAKSTEAGDASGVVDSTRWKDSIRLATGGIDRYNGRSVVLPWGVPYGQFKDGVRARIDELEASGQLPAGMTVGRMRDLPLESVGDGRYVFRAGDGVLVSREKDDALRGELGVLYNKKGEATTELSITVTDKRLNQGKPTNIPTLVKGQVDVPALQEGGAPSQAQEDIAIKRAAERVKAGANLPSHDTVDAAVTAARARSTGKKMQPYSGAPPLRPVLIDFNKAVGTVPPERVPTPAEMMEGAAL